VARQVVSLQPGQQASLPPAVSLQQVHWAR
jgi:hypothetical protein